MHGQMFRLLRIGVGSLLILLGLIGLFLPILQGVLFLVVGGLLLFRDIPFLRRFWRWLKTRYPGIGRAAERIRKKFLRRQ
jgi:uncharacterized membrane protein YbaN (DUF454 family)